MCWWAMGSLGGGVLAGHGVSHRVDWSSGSWQARSPGWELSQAWNSIVVSGAFWERRESGQNCASET